MLTGRSLNGIHFAMTFLRSWQSVQNGLKEPEYDEALLGAMARDKRVVVIGGGDTGCDCIATSLRQVICFPRSPCFSSVWLFYCP